VKRMGSPVSVGTQRSMVAFDPSTHAEHALDVALLMAAGRNAELFVVSVTWPPEPTRYPNYEEQNLRERRSTGAQMPPMPILNVIHKQLMEVLTANGRAAGKA
jgi:hypothetical protein